MLPFKFRHADDLREGLAVVRDEEGLSFYIDRSSRQAFPGKFPRASHFFGGLAHVELPKASGEDDTTMAYIDRNGQVVFRYQPETDY